MKKNKFSILILLIFVILFYLNCKIKQIDTSQTEPDKNYLSTQWANYWIAKLKQVPETRQRQNLAKEQNQKGFDLYKNKKDKDAVEWYEKSLDSFPSGETYYNYGNSLSNTNRLEDSILAYRLALHLNTPRPELALYNIACSYSRLNKIDDAYEYLAKAIERGYNAISHIQTDPDMENLRKDPEWETKIQKLINPKEYTKEDLAGKLEIGYVPRGAENYLLCTSGVAIQRINPFDGIGGACGDNSAFENTKYMYKIGKWDIEKGDLKIIYEKECTPKILPTNKNSNDPSLMGCQGLAGKAVFQKCSNSITQGNKIITFTKEKVRHITGETTEPDVTYTLKQNVSEPKQCEPNFTPNSLDDLKIE